MLKTKYACVRQHDMKDCGAACIATICKTYGSKKSISKLRELSGTDNKGTSAYGLVKTFEELNFESKGIKVAKPEDLMLDFPKPCIAHVIIDQKVLHYVVIHKVANKKVIIADPAKGLRTYKLEDFFKIWTGILILAIPKSNFKKENENEGVLIRFFQLLLPQKKLLFSIFISSFVYTVLGILASFYFKIILDEILPNSLEKTLFFISIAIILLYVFKSLLELFRNYLIYLLTQKIDIPLILGFYQHILKLPLNFFGTRKVGEVISRFMDATKIRDAISRATLSLMIDTIMAFAGGVILYLQNSTLFIIAFVMIFLYASIVFAFNKPLKSIQEKSMEENAQVTSYLVETVNGIQTIKSYNAEKQCEIETETRFVKLIKTNFKNGMIINLETFFTTLISSLGLTILTWIGAKSVLSGDLSIGALITFNVLLTYFIDPIKNLINLQPTMQTAIVASERLVEIFDLDIESDLHPKNTVKLDKLNGNITFKDVNFRYGTRQLILKDINLSFKGGDKIAFVGESGSGKSTLAKLLLNYYSPEAGEISIDNLNIEDIDINALRKRISYVSQDTFLFSGTIAENLRLADPSASLEELIRVCELTQAHNFINELPLRYDTYVEEGGANLSGGQKQRLAISRALLKNPDVLILDEATSSLDTITEKMIEETLNKFTKKITTIIIAHRLSTIVSCDKIYVMSSGRIVEEGKHNDLINSNGIYAKLWFQQTKGDSYE